MLVTSEDEQCNCPCDQLLIVLNKGVDRLLSSVRVQSSVEALQQTKFTTSQGTKYGNDSGADGVKEQSDESTA